METTISENSHARNQGGRTGGEFAPTKFFAPNGKTVLDISLKYLGLLETSSTLLVSQAGYGPENSTEMLAATTFWKTHLAVIAQSSYVQPISIKIMPLSL